MSRTEGSGFKESVVKSVTTRGGGDKNGSKPCDVINERHLLMEVLNLE